MFRAAWIASALFFATATVASAIALGADQVNLALIDGRNLVGVVDNRTDESTLWLRQEESGVVLSVPIVWDQIASANIDAQRIEVTELQTRRDELATSGPALLYEGATPPSATSTPGTVVRTFMPQVVPCRVRNIEVVAASLVHFDRDAAPDGVSVSVVAVGMDGVPIAVDGYLRVELHGERRSIGDASPRFEVLDRWAKNVRAVDFIDGVATYSLPFRQTAPEWEVDIAPDAELTVRLGATGHGNYAAAAPVLLRHFNPLRDDLQQHRGTRFLPNEPFQRPLNPFGERAGLWQWWAQ